MTLTQKELIEAVLSNSLEKVYRSISELGGRYAALYILYLVKYTKWDVDKFINLLSVHDDNETEFVKNLRLKVFL